MPFFSFALINIPAVGVRGQEKNLVQQRQYKTQMEFDHLPIDKKEVFPYLVEVLLRWHRAGRGRKKQRAVVAGALLIV